MIPSDNTDPLTRYGYTVRNAYTDIGQDNVTAYWEFHDGWSSARQVILDPKGNVRFEIDWVKQVSTVSPGVQSQWKALLTVKPLDET